MTRRESDSTDLVGSVAGTEVGAASASETGGEETVLLERDDRDGETTEPELEPASEPQVRMLDAVEAFAREHRRELATRDEWTAHESGGESEASAPRERPDGYPGGRPGAVPTEAARDAPAGADDDDP